MINAVGGPDLGRLARGGALNLMAAGGSAVANVGLVLLVTRSFPAAEAGVFFAATTVFLLGARIAELGTTTGLVFFVSRFRALGQEHRVRECLRTAITPVVAASVVAGAVLFAFADRWAAVAVRGEPGGFATYLRVLAVFLPVAAVSDTLLAATRGYGAMRPTALLERAGRPAGQLLLTIAAVAVGSGTALTVAWVLPYAVTAVLAWTWLRALRSRRTPGPAAEVAEPLGFWRFTAPRALASVAQLALQRLDIVLVAALRGPADAAVYAAATRFLVVGQVIGQAITQAVQPQLAGLLAVGDRPGANRLYQTATAWLVLTTWPFYLVFTLLAPAVLAVFGPGYAAGAVVVGVLAGAMLVATACGMVDTVLTMAGRTTWNLGNAVAALTVNVAVDLLLIPRLGILGAAVGWAAAIAVNNLVPLAQVRWSLGLHPLGRGTRVAVGVCGGCLGVLPWVVTRIAGDGPGPLAGSLAAGAVLAALACLRYRDALDLAALRHLRRRHGREVPA
jgi:O-antigen/teichoic acid export membrane protein